MNIYIKRASVIVFTLVMAIANMGMFAMAEGTSGVRKTEGVLSFYYEVAYAIRVRKTDKEGNTLNGSKFVAYITDETWDLTTATRALDDDRMPYDICPDLDSGKVDANNGSLIFYAGNIRESCPLYIVIREEVSPEGYEHETDKLYYVKIEENYHIIEHFKLCIEPQSQNDAYIDEDGCLVLENTKPAKEEPEDPTPEDPKSEEPVEEPNEILTEAPVDDSKKPEPAEPAKEEPTADNITDSVLPKTSDFNIAVFVTAFVLSGAVIGILLIRAHRVKKQD